MGSPFGDDEQEDGQSSDESTSSGAVSALASPSTGAAPKNIPDVTGVHGGASKGAYEGVSTPPEDDIVSTLAPSNAGTSESSAPEEETTGDDFTSGNYGGGGGGMTPGPRMTAPALPTPPQYQDENSLYHQVEQDQTLDPSKYKPSIGRRAIAGIAGALAAFGHNPNAYQIGEGVLNGPLDRAKAQQASRLQVDQTALTAADRSNAQARQSYNDQVQQYGMAERGIRNQGYVNDQNAQADSRRALAQSRANAVTGFEPKDPNNPWAGGTATTAGGKQIPNSPPPAAWLKDWSGTPQGKTALLSMTIQQRQKLGQQLGLKGDKLQYFTVNGKLSEPSQHTTIVDHEGGFSNTSTRNGGEGNGRGGSKGPANPDENVESIVAKATQDKQAFADQWQRADDGSYESVDGTKHISGPEFNARIDKFRTDANPKLAKYGAQIDAQGKVQRGGSSGQQPAQVPQQAQQPQQQQPVPQQQPKQDATKLPNGSKARNPKTGKVDWIVQGGKWVPAQ